MDGVVAWKSQVERSVRVAWRRPMERNVSVKQPGGVCLLHLLLTEIGKALKEPVGLKQQWGD